VNTRTRRLPVRGEFHWITEGPNVFYCQDCGRRSGNGWADRLFNVQVEEGWAAVIIVLRCDHCRFWTAIFGYVYNIDLARLPGKPVELTFEETQILYREGRWPRPLSESVQCIGAGI
jgi:hypothetical protein